ncbi:MAG TPA: twin-arginine translocase TatA/TatE family subunit [Gemmatimonadetes bacterium]|nr:twin-arginine translocase TatA/TatE family subunit [Gemmatimonadota bacterium]
MTGLGVWEILLIVMIVVFFFGAKRIPVIGRGIGEGIRNFKGALKESDDSPGDSTLEESSSQRTLSEPADQDRS